MYTFLFTSPHLLWYLTEVVDEPNSGVFLERIIYAEDIYVTLVEQMMKDVYGIYCCLSSLFVPEY